MRVGVLGGTFNPIHYGHLRAAEEVLEGLRLDEVRYIPAGTHPFKNEGLAGTGDRLEMALLATGCNPRFRVLDMEAGRAGTSYTVDTLSDLRGRYPGASLFFILGTDAFLELPEWKDAGKIVSLADLAIVCRPPEKAVSLIGAEFLDMDPEALASLDRGEQEVAEGRLKGMEGDGRRAFVFMTTRLGISATEIRERLRLGRSVTYLLPVEVESFIMSKGLYRR